MEKLTEINGLLTNWPPKISRLTEGPNFHQIPNPRFDYVELEASKHNIFPSLV